MAGAIFRNVIFFVHCMYCRMVVVICAIICIVLIISFMTYIYRKEKGTSICIRKCTMLLFYIQFFIFRWCIFLILVVCWLLKQLFLCRAFCQGDFWRNINSKLKISSAMNWMQKSLNLREKSVNMTINAS